MHFTGFKFCANLSFNDIHDGLLPVFNFYNIKFCAFVQIRRNIKR